MPDIVRNSESSTAGAAPLFLTLPAAARLLGVSAPTARGMAREGSLPIVKVGQRRMVIASLLNDVWFMREEQVQR
jgi:excisionase family DNA binding protein